MGQDHDDASSASTETPATAPTPALDAATIKLESPVVKTEELPVQEVPRARQIVSINEEGNNFELDEHALREIFDQVPEDMKVAIVSVVGAFRTGKSFVLDLFLRYLRNGNTKPMLSSTGAPPDSDDWMKWLYAGLECAETTKLEGNSNVEQTNGEKGFSWRAGRKRNTTGIWLWEQPFYRKSSSGEDIAVFLLDTQGMFDSETSQMLTASIFGLSTLLSSYQIYNVDKRVQEDNLQHLALFTEYGRMALFGGDDSSANSVIELHRKNSIAVANAKLERAASTVSQASATNEGETDKEEEEEPHLLRPFQRLDFLVRDWQDFTRKQTLAEKREDMKQYMQELLSSRKQKDLADTREQINACFERVACFLLPHPGYAVTEPEFDGAIADIDTRFLELLTSYLDEVFDEKNLSPKKIHGIPVTSRELFTFIKSYAALFRDSTIFPEAKTLLEATAEANNVNMKEKAMLTYKKEMNKLVGPKCQYVPVIELQKHHEVCFEGAMTVFDTGARMGRHSEILAYRARLVDEIEAERQRYSEVNAERDPYKNLVFYMVPGSIAFALLVFRITQDLFCYDNIGYDIPLYDCKHVSTTLSLAYWSIIVFMFLIMLSTGQVMLNRVKTVVAIIRAAVDGAKEAKPKAE